MTAQRIDPKLEAAFKAGPQAEFQLLVRVSQADDTAERTLESLGLTVRRRLQLVPTLAVTGTGAGALALLAYPWVIQIEEDRPVHIMALASQPPPS